MKLDNQEWLSIVLALAALLVITWLMMGCSTTSSEAKAWTNLQDPTRDFDADSYQCAVSTDYATCLRLKGWVELQ